VRRSAILALLALGAALSVAVCLTAGIGGCGGSSAYTGHWVLPGMTFEFRGDGTGTMRTRVFGANVADPFAWREEGDHIAASGAGEDRTYHLAEDGKILVLKAELPMAPGVPAVSAEIPHARMPTKAWEALVRWQESEGSSQDADASASSPPSSATAPDGAPETGYVGAWYLPAKSFELRQGGSGTYRYGEVRDDVRPIRWRREGGGISISTEGDEKSSSAVLAEGGAILAFAPSGGSSKHPYVRMGGDPWQAYDQWKEAHPDANRELREGGWERAAAPPRS